MSHDHARLSFAVTHADTAIALGSGDVPVLATPRLIAWLEAATVSAIPALGEDETSVGTRVDIEHLAASPVGAAIQAVADLVHRDGRLLRFAVAAHHDVGDGPVLIARGEVTRVVVRRQSFLARVDPELVIREALPDELPAVGELRVAAYVEGYGMAPGEGGYADVLRDATGQASVTRAQEPDRGLRTERGGFAPKRPDNVRKTGAGVGSAGHADGATILVALRQGELVGTVTIAEAGTPLAELAESGEVEFRFMAVSPSAWRQGIARALLAAVVDRTRGRPLVCSVIDGNDPAADLYLSCGFVRQSDRDHEPAPGVLLRAYARPTD